MKCISLFIALFALAFSASAQTSSPATLPAPIDATATDTHLAERPASYPADRNCLKETGSRIAPAADRKGRKCINAPGRSYVREDVERTGAGDLKDALRRLDPAVH